MRHGKKFNHLGRKAGHRKALLKNLSIALITHKRINTTLAKAKALRKHVEPLITKSRNNTTHSRRVVFSYLQNKEAVKELFDVIAGKIGDRPGGYCRIIKTGFRKSDAAEMAMIELVDFNEVYVNPAKKAKSTETSGGGRRRSRRGKKKKGGDAAAAATTAAAVSTTTATEEEE
ncbi:MAG: 50S ribosomal protein L17 [Bacteroidota bacterium]